MRLSQQRYIAPQVTGMKHNGWQLRWLATACVVLAVIVLAIWFVPRPAPDAGTAQQRVRVLLIPADGGTASGTIADYRPLFASLTRITGLRFELTVTQSYSAAVEGICAGAADMAFVGPAAYLQARNRKCAELLATGVKNGQSLYYAAVFVQEDSPIRSLAELRGKRMAFGDINSTSSFLMPVAMLIDAGLDPARDLAAVRLTGSHPNSLGALLQGRVDAAALSLDSYDRALRAGVPGAERLRVLARSDPMPYPPFIASTRLDPAIRNRLRHGFGELSQNTANRPQRIPGYAGSSIDGYSTIQSDRAFDVMAARIARVGPTVKAAMLRRAAER